MHPPLPVAKVIAAIGARTSRIELGIGVIDMRYENQLYMAGFAGPPLDQTIKSPISKILEIGL
jgi:hypothetical protein